MPDLALWTNGVHYCVAESAEEAERMQPTDPNEELDEGVEPYTFERVSGDKQMYIIMRADAIVQRLGVGFVFTDEDL